MTESTHRPRLGRPPRPSGEVRSERVVTFLTPGEMQAIRQLATDREQSLSETCHRLLRQALSHRLGGLGVGYPESGSK